MNNVPALRYKAFTDTWEQRELWALTTWDKKFNEVEKEKQPRVIKYPYVLADKLNSLEDNRGTVLLLSTGTYVGFTTEEKAGSNLCEGEVVAIPWGGTPNIKYWSGKFVTADNRIATSNDSRLLQNKFMYYWMNNQINNIDKIYRGASIKHPSMNDVLNMKVYYPSLTEQERISSALTNLDSLITLHQRKCDVLKNYKKGLLNTMFPEDGCFIPVIRFKGFNDAWEQRKLDSFGVSTSGTSIESEFSNKGQYKVISIGSYSEESKYNDQGIRAVFSSKIKNRILNKNDLTMILNDKTSSGRIIGRVLLIDQNNMYVFNQRTERIEVDKNTYNPLFLYELLNADNIRSKIIGSSQGNTQIYVNWSLIKEIYYFVPLNQVEQVKIGTLFSSLDSLITLHQRKVDSLKNLKKALLQEMFVS